MGETKVLNRRQVGYVREMFLYEGNGERWDAEEICNSHEALRVRARETRRLLKDLSDALAATDEDWLNRAHQAAIAYLDGFSTTSSQELRDAAWDVVHERGEQAIERLRGVLES
jgi:hypothetical protein